MPVNSLEVELQQIRQLFSSDTKVKVSDSLFPPDDIKVQNVAVVLFVVGQEAGENTFGSDVPSFAVTTVNLVISASNKKFTTGELWSDYYNKVETILGDNGWTLVESELESEDSKGGFNYVITAEFEKTG